ncbi:hypothetical protein, partial [Mesorhizobium sp. M2A.F.Ca.ET.029.05.1.1]|uniref:hypothetical protein n=1 Tax=Mesorhizobium sp. M2A.F.Ca.ET.029.05.1.1 TaxID=2496658 RepID=UPI001FE1BEB3
MRNLLKGGRISRSRSFVADLLLDGAVADLASAIGLKPLSRLDLLGAMDQSFGACAGNPMGLVFTDTRDASFL